MIVSWVVCLLRGDVEAPTYLKDTWGVLVIIGSFYPDILVVLGGTTRVHLVSDKLKECLPYVPFEGFARHRGFKRL